MALKHRMWNHFKAVIGGYFWIPCPICGQMFGGHEKCGELATSFYRGEGTCIECAPEAKRLSDELYKKLQEEYYMDENGSLTPILYARPVLPEVDNNG